LPEEWSKKMFETMTKKQAARQILDGVKAYYKTFMRTPPYKDGERIPYASRVFDENEMTNLVDSALEFWLTSGRYTGKFEKQFAEYLGVPFCSLVNSGSSANLIGFMALTSPLLGERAIKRGDEVITVAAGFPTTVTPILQFGAVPVFVDLTIPQYNIDVSLLEKALSPKTKAVMLAHTLGNPFDLQTVKAFCSAYKLWLVEDNCDALGSTYTIDGIKKFTGTIGDIGTSSFYPPHHMTMGEGGAVYTSNALLHKIIRSMRDWGRDCACPSGKDNLCGHRFDRQYGELPHGYDHKYVYSHFGYNLKATDMQAAIGCAQLEKLPSFVEKRKNNWQRLREGLRDLQDYLILPEAATNSDPSWFGFLISCKESVNRTKLVQYIESKNIQTRMLFAGNLLKHPCFDELRKAGSGYRIAGNLNRTERIMNDTFWIGVYPGMTCAMIDRMIETVREGVKQNSKIPPPPPTPPIILEKFTM
jgi:CDP-6-deoxy-D-xylo-4-hexulose-3-dehydrase